MLWHSPLGLGDSSKQELLTEEAGGREPGAGGKEFMPLRKATWFQAPGFIHG